MMALSRFFLLTIEPWQKQRGARLVRKLLWMEYVAAVQGYCWFPRAMHIFLFDIILSDAVNVQQKQTKGSHFCYCETQKAK